MTQPKADLSSSKDLNRIDLAKQVFKCRYCDFKTNWRPSLSKHKRKHIREKEFKCFACDYRSARRDTLMLHYRSHTGVKPYSCNTCDFRCSLKTTLNIHKKTHTKEKCYKCTMCEKVFVKSCFLKFHEKGHMRESPNNCKVSECTCKNKSNAKVKPYTCDLCPFKYACLSNLALHKRTHKKSVEAKKSKDGTEKTTVESEPEIQENLTLFYAQLDQNEMSELALSPTMYQQLVDEEYLNSATPNLAFHKIIQNKSLNANNTKEKAKDTTEENTPNPENSGTLSTLYTEIDPSELAGLALSPSMSRQLADGEYHSSVSPDFSI